MGIVQIIGLSSVSFGLVDIIAWHTEAFRVVGDNVPYGGAVVFCTIGIALIALHYRWCRTAFALGAFTVTFTTIRFIEFRTGYLSIATELTHWLGAPRRPLAPASVTGAVSFTLYGLGAMLMSIQGPLRWRPLAMAFIGAISFALCVFGLSGHVVAIPEIPGVGAISANFLPRDIGCLALSIAMLAFARGEIRRVREYAPLWISVPIATAGLIVCLLTWQALRTMVGPHHAISLGLVLYGGSAMVVIIALFAASIQTTRRRTRELEESYRLLHSVIDSSTDGIFVKDLEDRFLMVNQSSARIFGRTPEEVIGRRGVEIATSANAEESRKVDDTVRETGRSATYEYETRQNGIWRAYLVSKAPYRNREGEIVGVLGTARDITERKLSDARLRESEEKFRRIFDDAQIGMILTEHAGGRLARVNRAFLELLQYSEEDLATLGLPAVTHPEDRVSSAQTVADVRSGRLLTARVEKRYVRSDGVVVWGDVRFMTIRNRREEPTYLLAQVVDITARKEAEATMREFNVTLEQRVEERTRALVESRETLQKLAGDLTRSNEELQHFAYIASHDLQEPLRMIASYLTLLERRTAGKLDGEQVDFIRFAVDGAKRMKLLIDDLLKFSRVGSRNGDRALVDTGEVIDGALANLKFAVADAGGRVVVGDMPTVRADAVQLTQLFQNLVGNALKFRRGDSAAVEISARRDGDMWEFTVRDEGIGFEMQYAERIFEIFQRLHSREDYPGTGVGLAICKKIVERHGGRIWARAAPNGGAVFCFTLPVAPEVESELAAQAGHAADDAEEPRATILPEGEPPRDVGL